MTDTKLNPVSDVSWDNLDAAVWKVLTELLGPSNGDENHPLFHIKEGDFMMSNESAAIYRMQCLLKYTDYDVQHLTEMAKEEKAFSFMYDKEI